MIRTEEQDELAGIVRALLTKRADSAAVRIAMESAERYDTELWQTMCDQIGVAALAIDEQHGGAGFTLAETCVVLEELGRSLAPSPLLATTVAAFSLRSSPLGAELLPRIAAGEIATLAAPGLTMFGTEAAIVLGYVDGSLQLLEEATEPVESMDPTWPLARTTAPVKPWPQDVHDAALSLGSALQVGTMQRALDDTVAYSKEREQFGRPIGSFQALKHRMADMLVLLEMSRSAHLHAVDGLVSGTDDFRVRAAVAAAYCSEALSKIAGDMVQLHGGIAITWEHDAHLVFKRAHALSQMFGQVHEHRARLAL